MIDPLNSGAGLRSARLQARCSGRLCEPP